MSTSKTTDVVAEVLSRQSNASFKHATVRLCDLDHQTKRHVFCHRMADALKYGDEDGDPMKTLVDSLLLEGPQVPVEYYVDPETGDKILLRGYRRIEAIKIAIERQFQPDRFHPEMEISAIEVESPAGYLDYLVRSVCDNEVRQSLTDDEKILAAEKMLMAGVSSSRAAHALGMSATHFARYQRRINSLAMREHISKNHLTATDADNLLEAANSVNRIKELERDFGRIVAKIEDHIASLRAEAIKNQNEFKDDKLGNVSKHFNAGHVRQWIKDIKESKLLDWSPEPKSSGWTYECTFDPKEGKIKIQGLTIDAHRMPCEDLGQLSGKLYGMQRKVESLWKKKQAEQKIWAGVDQEQDEDLIDYYTRHHADDLADKLRKKAAQALGETDPSHGQVVPRQEESIASVIEVPPPDSPTEFDPMIDGGPTTPVSDNKARKGRSAR